MKSWLRTSFLTVASAVALVLALAAPALAAAGPRISFALPGEVDAGNRVVASGAVSEQPAHSRVRVVELRAGAWTPLGGAPVRGGRYRVRLELPTGVGSERLRAELVAGGRTVATSPARTLRLRAGEGEAPTAAGTPSVPVVPSATQTSAPAAPVTAAPVVTTPPAHEPEPPVEGELGPPVAEEEPTQPPAEEQPVGPQPYEGPMYWGAWIEGAPWDWSKVTAFEQHVHKELSLLEFSSPFEDCTQSPCAEESFPLTPFEKIRAEGAIPFFSWSSESIPAAAEEPAFQLRDVIAGTYDSYIRSWAAAAARWGHPFFLRFDWEMNGNWFPWGQGVNGNAAGEYVTAWNHMRAIFAEEHATNATWVWCPFVDPTGSANIADPEAFYPGDASVDWTGLDGYNWGTRVHRNWHPFSYWFGASYDRLLQIAPAKPMLIGETATSEFGGSKPQWIEAMFDSLPTRFPRLRGLIYFDQVDGENDWPLEGSTGAESAFAAGVAPSRWLGGSLSGLEASPIPPP
jgi:hypothetical protein